MTLPPASFFPITPRPNNPAMPIESSSFSRPPVVRLLAFLLLALAAVVPGWAASAEPLEESWRLLSRESLSPAETSEVEALCRAVMAAAPGQDRVALAWHRLGCLELFHRRKTDAAKPCFEEARRLAEPTSETWAESTYCLATVLHHTVPYSRNGVEAAATLYRELLETQPENRYRSRCWLQLGRISELRDYEGDPPDRAAARECYQRVIERTGDPWQDEAVFRWGGTLVEDGLYPQDREAVSWEERLRRIGAGAEYLTAWIEQRPQSPYAPAFWEYIGNTWLLPQDEALWPLALRAFLRAAGDDGLEESGRPAPRKTNPDRVDMGYFYWRVGMLAQKLNQRRVAFEYYIRVYTEAPTYIFALSGLQQLEFRMGFTRAEILHRMQQQYEWLGRTELETETLLQAVSFLPPHWDGSLPPTP